MDEATGDLKLPLQNDCESLQIHVEVHQKSNRLVFLLQILFHIAENILPFLSNE